MIRNQGFLIAVLILGLSSPVFSQEFEVNSSTNLGVSSNPASPLSFSERLDGKFSLPFDLRGGGLELRAHAQAGVLPTPMTFAGDLDVFTLTFAYQKPTPDLKALKWTLGRFALNEPTGLILNHPGDGMKLVFDYQAFDVTIVTAYTGFVLKPSSTLSMTLADQASATAQFASPRFIGSLDVGFPFFGNQVSLSALAQQDLNNRSTRVTEWTAENQGNKGGALDTQYLTLKVAGPIVDKLFYDVFGTFGSGTTLSYISDKASPTKAVYAYQPIVSFLAGANLSLYLPQLMSSAVSARVLAASGDTDATSPTEGNTAGDSNQFLPMTAGSLGVVFNPALSNLVFYEVGGSIKPFEGMPVTLGGKVLGFQRMGKGVINAPGVLRTGDLWLGQELDLTATWQAFSDLTVSGTTGVFLPAAGTFAPNSPAAQLQYAIRMGVNISL